MLTNSNKISQFWQELKRRSVLRSLAIYAGSAFVILEAATIIFPRWGLPDWAIDLVLYLLILGALIAIIVAWIFDITPEGVQKTKPADEIGDSEKPSDSKAWKASTYISLVVIVALIIFNVVPFNKHARAGTIKSLVVLPFDNYTGTDEFEYFVSGMHSGLIGDIGKISALRVISKTSSRLFKDVDMSIPEIASELGVDAVIEASVLCIEGDSVCIRIKLVSAFPEEQQLWVQDYRVEKSQILNFYNDVTKTISEEINIFLTPQEENMLAETRTVDPEAYDAYLMGQFYWEKLDPEFMEKALEYFQRAIELEPEWADPYASLATVYGSFYVLPKSVTLPLKYKYLNRAMELDPNSANVRYVKAGTAVWTEWDWEQGEREFLKSLELNPNNALCRLYYAHLLMILRRSDEAVHQANLGLELDPLKPLVLGLYGVVMRNEGDYLSAVTHFEKALSIDPNFGFASSNLAAAYWDNRDEKWFNQWKKVVCWDTEVTAIIEKVYYEDGHVAAIEKLLKLNEEYGDEFCKIGEGISVRKYLQVKNYEKAIDNLEKWYESRQMNITYIATNLNQYEQLKDYPRYIELLKKMNLPLGD